MGDGREKCTWYRDSTTSDNRKQDKNIHEYDTHGRTMPSASDPNPFATYVPLGWHVRKPQQSLPPHPSRTGGVGSPAAHRTQAMSHSTAHIVTHRTSDEPMAAIRNMQGTSKTRVSMECSMKCTGGRGCRQGQLVLCKWNAHMKYPDRLQTEGAKLLAMSLRCVCVCVVLTLNTTLWYVSVCTVMPPVVNTMSRISAMPT